MSPLAAKGSVLDPLSSEIHPHLPARSLTFRGAVAVMVWRCRQLRPEGKDVSVPRLMKSQTGRHQDSKIQSKTEAGGSNSEHASDGRLFKVRLCFGNDLPKTVKGALLLALTMWM
ncbi:hypothetical protein CLAIMM_00561 isoform 1 [Cladophialophora immunda]|nr:hypothetical protein CLAIMM_00561 isoform 1 [Cladophialophora immunda]